MRDYPGSVHVGVVGGTRLPKNVSTFLLNVRRLLKTHPVDFNFDIVVRRDVADDLEGFTVVDPGIEDTDRAIGTFRTLLHAVTRYVDTTKPDVLFQVTKFPIHGFVTSISGRWADTPVITRFAGDSFHEHQYSDHLVNKLRTLALNNVAGTVPVLLSDAIVVLGPHGRTEVERRMGQAVVREIPQPVCRELFSPISDRERMALREELGMASDDRVLLTVGRLTERKGMQDVVATARTLARRDLNVRWYVVGDGPLRELLESTPLVELVGQVPYELMPNYYRAADLLVHPSLIEGLPNVLIEAAACGLPSVSRDVGDAGSVASATFEMASRLPDIVLKEHNPVQLGNRFEPDALRDAYAKILISASNEAKS